MANGPTVGASVERVAESVHLHRQHGCGLGRVRFDVLDTEPDLYRVGCLEIVVVYLLVDIRSFEKVYDSGQFGAGQDELLCLLQMALPELAGFLGVAVLDHVQHHPVGLR